MRDDLVFDRLVRGLGKNPARRQLVLRGVRPAGNHPLHIRIAHSRQRLQLRGRRGVDVEQVLGRGNLLRDGLLRSCRLSRGKIRYRRGKKERGKQSGNKKPAAHSEWNRHSDSPERSSAVQTGSGIRVTQESRERVAFASQSTVIHTTDAAGDSGAWSLFEILLTAPCPVPTVRQCDQ